MDHSLMLFGIILLAVAVLMVPVAARLGLGAVLGYLLGGIVIGPSGFGLVNNSEAILHFAEFGVVMLLFLIGLELNPKRLWNLRRLIFGFGSLQLVSAAGLCGLGLYLWGWSWQAALVAGLGVAMSSTAIALQLIEEKGLRSHPAGVHGFPILLFQDLAVIPILILVSWLSVDVKPTTELTGIARFLAPLAAIGVLIFAGNYLTRPLFRWVSRIRIRELSIAVALLLIMAISYLMQSVGLSMALGAFLGGLTLADSEYRHELEANIEPFKGLLLGLFFMGVGMGIRMEFLWDNMVLVSFLLLGLLVIKVGSVFLIGRIFQMHWRSRLLLALLISQGGEFGFVLFGQALGGRIFTPEQYALLNATITLSMLLTPILLPLSEWLLPAPVLDETGSDDISDEGHSVIIAGFGRVGQIVARMLSATGYSSTVIDHDAQSVESSRRFGYKPYYGDASSLEILEAAGLKHAKLLVITIDDRDVVNRLVETVQRYYPEVPLLVRAFDRTHYYQLREKKVALIERETFGSAIEMGRKALTALGLSSFHATRAAQRFRQYDIKVLDTLQPYYKDEKQIASRSREARETLSKLFVEDAKELRQREDYSWD